MQLKEGERISIIGARQLAETESFFAGHGFPVLSAILAKRLYNPNLKICFESGAIYSNPERLPHSVSDIINYSSSQFPLDLPDAFAMLERGEVDVVGLSGAQVDSRGNINSTLINAESTIKRLPGSGGACDFASLGRKEYIFMFHELRRLVDKVDYITSPGLQTRSDKEINLITNYGVFKIGESGVEALILASDAEPEKVKSNTGFNLSIKSDVKRLEDFTSDEIKLLRKLDVYGIAHR
ncbi:MAG TPA: CoA-transferase [Candidatus Nanoarchaeia archaeon]|nr:CoA-transferase [Candidatus Nanoarchaeia archaeon]